MTTWRVIPICLALTMATATSTAAQDTRHSGSDGHQEDEHVGMGLFEELQQGDYSEAELAAIHAHFETIHQSIEEITGLHDHEGSARGAEELHEAGESAFISFQDAYESVVAELEEEHAEAFTAMLFQHLLHSRASHGQGGEGHAEVGGPHQHG